MAKNAGVWIDHKRAIVVLVTDAGQEIKKITSDIDKTGRPTSTSRSKHRYTKNDFVAEDTLERKDVSHRNKYYDEVIACLRGADAILILGPGEAKGEFSQHIKAKKLRGLTVELETTDKMSDRQIAAKVSEHFTKAPAKKSVAPKAKKAAKKKVGIATSGKPTKKSRK